MALTEYSGTSAPSAIKTAIPRIRIIVTSVAAKAWIPSFVTISPFKIPTTTAIRKAAPMAGTTPAVVATLATTTLISARMDPTDISKTPAV